MSVLTSHIFPFALQRPLLAVGLLSRWRSCSWTMVVSPAHGETNRQHYTASDYRKSGMIFLATGPPIATQDYDIMAGWCTVSQNPLVPAGSGEARPVLISLL